MEPSLPEFIYKYVKLDDYFYELIRNKQLWFPSPKEFNDPFDCKLYLFPGVINTGWEYGFNIPSLDVEKTDFKLLLKVFDRLIDRENLTEALQIKLDSCGICSFSKDSDNLLLWAHYADCHKGVCIKFRTDILIETFKIVKPVVYYDDFPILDPLKDAQNAINFAPFCKSKHWEYEEEVRIQTERKGLFSFPPEAIEQITFGLKCKIPSNKFMQSMNDLGYEKVKFMETKQARGQYKLYYNEYKQHTQHFSSHTRK